MLIDLSTSEGRDAAVAKAMEMVARDNNLTDKVELIIAEAGMRSFIVVLLEERYWSMMEAEVKPDQSSQFARGE